MSLFKRSSGPITDSANFLDTGGGGLLLFNAGPMPSNAPPTPFERGLTRDDPSNIGLNDLIQPGEGMEPTQELGAEDTIFQILMETIIGEQGIPEGVSAEAIEAIRSGIDSATISPRQLQEIAIDVAEAGGFDEWLESQQQEDDNDQEEEEGDVVFGDPGGIGDSTQSSTEIIFDENGNPVEIVIDPRLITLPPILGELPDEQEEGEGEGDGGGSGGGSGGGQGSGTGQDQGGQQGGYEYPDYPEGDPNYGYPDGLPGGGRGGSIYDVPVQEEAGFTVVPAIPSISTGSGGGGGGGGGSAATKRSTPNDFTPFMRRLNYQPVALTKPILPQAPIVSSLFSEYLK